MNEQDTHTNSYIYIYIYIYRTTKKSSLSLLQSWVPHADWESSLKLFFWGTLFSRKLYFKNFKKTDFKGPLHRIRRLIAITTFIPMTFNTTPYTNFKRSWVPKNYGIKTNRFSNKNLSSFVHKCTAALFPSQSFHRTYAFSNDKFVRQIERE